MVHDFLLSGSGGFYLPPPLSGSTTKKNLQLPLPRTVMVEQALNFGRLDATLSPALLNTLIKKKYIFPTLRSEEEGGGGGRAR